MNDSLRYARANNIQDLIGGKIAARLNASTDDLPYDITERLRAARTQALARRKVLVAQSSGGVEVMRGGTLSLYLGGKEGFGFWGRLASVLPLLGLIIGLIVIQVVQDDDRVKEIAEVDTALLTDDLPPQAYADPGFVQFLKSRNQEEH
jgi:hypothetical protein